MAHTVTLTTPAVVAKPATDAGALDGFQAQCPDCGFVIGSTFAQDVARDMREHVSYMAAKEAGPKALALWFRTPAWGR